MTRTLSSIVALLLVVSSDAWADDLVIADFEGTGYADWTASGDAFGDRPARGTLRGQQDVLGYRGRGLVNTFLDADRSTGTLTSPPFEIRRPYIAFLIGGGNHLETVGIELLADVTRVKSATGGNQEMLSWHTWDVSALLGKQVRLRIYDHSTSGFGHINVDQILATDEPRHGPGMLRLSDYAKTDDYYRERYRPQYHFTPPMNWMNDPNGLVYYAGEYHLFYQHNPHGNAWGHMSWGHAVSTDLVHWQHLPIALHEEYGVMIFSGCCVVDWKNTSGFGNQGEPPLVAIYTGHGLGKQTQDIAYSTDRGRTWTKYSGNPVIDKNEADFRDPKVFWHEPTNKWVMVVSMATAKYLEFYGSTDLKQWTHLSDFGPAGVEGKPNWECPDLFELPIEGEPGQTKWVLEVDMGSGAVAGGSGGEYFVGDFDGTGFGCDHDPAVSQWVDYGRDFYAPVSYSDIPASDGRRIWIGWMNNWQTNLLPTRPWRSAMSIPRTLSLRKHKTGYKLIQTPVEELTRLRKAVYERSNIDIAGNVELAARGDLFELATVIDVGDASEVGFKVRVGNGEETIVAYQAALGRLYVDRTRSGESDFHEAFPGKHSGPVGLTEGKLELRIFVDTSSVEVFANGGETVITDRIFPKPSSNDIEAFSVGGTATIETLKVWQLDSVWKQEMP